MQLAAPRSRRCCPGLTPPRLILIALALWLLQGCAAVTLTPPPVPDDPVTVAVLDHGRHSSLILPAAIPDTWVRYSYGDWTYYVERRTNLSAGLTSLILPTRAGLGRQILGGSDLPDAIRSQLRVPLEASYLLIVNRDRATALREELEAIWLDGHEDRRVSAEWGMAFVEHPEAYTLRNNSNRMVARWLRRLDVEVSRTPVLSNWQIESR
ncbi:hypothetical protein [Thioalkalivibrio sp. ALJT]|uniref:hypothetical protein n=1 Tax=Thioalkalivibrio sp. ALJT TaxID=1158146 RepID=UPI000366B917|nr:hypothetical protein [Thioalkalivibrio sp. ALJT]